MRRISSRMTFFYKWIFPVICSDSSFIIFLQWIFPVIWFGFLIVFVGIGVFGSQRSCFSERLSLVRLSA